MISLIIGTNRPGSNSSQIARLIEKTYLSLGVPFQVIDLGLISPENFTPEAHTHKPPSFTPFAEAVLRSDGLVVVCPEYNGSMPGILKSFIDLLPFPESFDRRPVCFVGLSAGQWGGLRGVEHLQQIFGYRNAYVFPERVFIPNVRSVVNPDGKITDSEIIERLGKQAKGFVDFVQAVKGIKLTPATTPEVPAHLKSSLAVCSWSLQPQSPEELVTKLKEIGILRVQLALDPLLEKPEIWGHTQKLFKENGIQIVSGMFGCQGEDYTTLETIKQTGGLVPDHTWDKNWSNINKISNIASQLDLTLVTFHAGFLPHDPEDPNFAKLVERLRMVANVFATREIDLAFETGQETAGVLRSFLTKLSCPNIGVNFDPANMILYDKGNPIFALRALAPWVKQCHLKDANRTLTPGTWGEEVTLGTGEVNWRAFFRCLQDIGFKADLAIEREAGNQRVADIQTARQFVQNL